MTILVITGNPGVGKHTIAKFISEKFEKTRVIDINKVAIDNNAILKKSNKDGIEVDVKKADKIDGA